MRDEKEPKFWIRVVKLLLWTVVAIALVGVLLYYTAKFNTYEPPGSPGGIDWGITTDSPIRSNR